MCFIQALEPCRELGDSPGYFKHDHNTCYDFALTELPTVLCLFAAMLSTHPAAVFLSFSVTYPLSPRHQLGSG